MATPDSAATMPAMVGTVALDTPDAIERAKLPEDARSWNLPTPGTSTTKGASLFPRAEPPEIETD